MNIFEQREQRLKLEEEIRQAKKSFTNQKRIDRELKKVQSGGRVSSFLKRQAESSSTLAASVNMSTARDPFSLGQAIIQYQGTINKSKRDLLYREPREKPDTPSTEEGVVVSQATIHPWKISIRTVPESDPLEYQYKVEPNSYLYSGLGSWDSIVITGLDVWQNISNSGYIILSGTVAGGVCTDAIVQGPQDPIPDRVTFSGGAQDSFAVQLGYIYQDGGVYYARQNAFQNFSLINVCVSGSPAICPIST